MSSFSIDGKNIEINEKGFLKNYSHWDNRLCKQMAQSEGLELDARRWTVIYFLRDFYEAMGTFPSVHVLIRKIGDQIAHFRCTHRNIHLLFPGGGCRQACRLAGLPEYFNHGC